jgi:hypothetical protein
MTLEERVIDVERQLQQALINERQAVEIRLRTEGALISLRQLLEEERAEKERQKKEQMKDEESNLSS